MIGFIGPLFWPFAEADFIDFTFYPYGYDAFWPYAYNNLYEDIFGTYAYGEGGTAYAASGGGTGYAAIGRPHRLVISEPDESRFWGPAVSNGSAQYQCGRADVKRYADSVVGHAQR